MTAGLRSALPTAEGLPLVVGSDLTPYLSRIPSVPFVRRVRPVPSTPTT